MTKGFIKYDLSKLDDFPDLSAIEWLTYLRVCGEAERNGEYCKPISDIAFVIRSSEKTARRTLQSLVNRGMLKEETEDGRPNTYRPLPNWDPSQIGTPPKLSRDPSQIVHPIIIDIIDNREREKKNARTREEKQTSKFKKPTIEEIAAYCGARANGINAEEFHDFYESKGWVVGKSPMKDWHAAVRTWEQKRKQHVNNKQYGKHQPTNPADAARAAFVGIALADAEE